MSGSAPSPAEGPDREVWRALHRRATRELGLRLDFALARLAAHARTPPSRLTVRPATGWSALEVLEHVTLADRSLLALARKTAERSRRRIQRGEPWPAHAPAAERLEELARLRERWPHPPRMTPSGDVPPSELARRLDADRLACAALLTASPAGEGTLHSIRMSRLPDVGAKGRLDLYGWLELTRLHAERHLAQLERVLARQLGAR